MKKINLFTYIVFFAFVLFYWFMKKSGNTIDSHSYLMIMVIVLFLLYIVRVILRFKRIKGYQDPYERTGNYDEKIGENEQATVYTLDDEQQSKKKVSVKKVMLIVIALLGIVVDDPDSAEALNKLLSEYRDFIVGRMGIPYRSRGINLISIVIDAPQDAISAITGKIGMLKGVTAKALYSKVGEA